MMFAQADIGQLPAGFLKEMAIVFIGGLVATAFVVAALVGILQYALDARRNRREELAAANPSPTTIEPNPLPVTKISPTASLRELNEKHQENVKRLDSHDDQINQLWTTLRAENTAIRKENSDKFDSISRALGRIEGKLSGKSEE